MAPSKWNLFVKKIYHEGKRSNPNYEFKNALKDASKRKAEMGHSGSKTKTPSKMRRKRSANLSLAGGKRTRKRRRHN
jgi:hypothetical protein